ncbi:unnamed protein product [Amoebophrya sp. A120]|nr:unnamed protein product [Amoebophrya sp. A120]|eukprot:GSA120T00006793001.1
MTKCRRCSVRAGRTRRNRRRKNRKRSSKASGKKNCQYGGKKTGGGRKNERGKNGNKAVPASTETQLATEHPLAEEAEKKPSGGHQVGTSSFSCARRSSSVAIKAADEQQSATQHEDVEVLSAQNKQQEHRVARTTVHKPSTNSCPLPKSRGVRVALKYGSGCALFQTSGTVRRPNKGNKGSGSPTSGGSGDLLDDPGLTNHVELPEDLSGRNAARHQAGSSKTRRRRRRKRRSSSSSKNTASSSSTASNDYSKETVLDDERASDSTVLEKEATGKKKKAAEIKNDEKHQRIGSDKHGRSSSTSQGGCWVSDDQDTCADPDAKQPAQAPAESRGTSSATASPFEFLKDEVGQAPSSHPQLPDEESSSAGFAQKVEGPPGDEHEQTWHNRGDNAISSAAATKERADGTQDRVGGTVVGDAPAQDSHGEVKKGEGAMHEGAAEKTAVANEKTGAGAAVGSKTRAEEARAAENAETFVEKAEESGGGSVSRTNNRHAQLRDPLESLEAPGTSTGTSEANQYQKGGDVATGTWPGLAARVSPDQAAASSNNLATGTQNASRESESLPAAATDLQQNRPDLGEAGSLMLTGSGPKSVFLEKEAHGQRQFHVDEKKREALNGHKNKQDGRGRVGLGTDTVPGTRERKEDEKTTTAGAALIEKSHPGLRRRSNSLTAIGTSLKTSLSTALSRPSLRGATRLPATFRSPEQQWQDEIVRRRREAGRIWGLHREQNHEDLAEKVRRLFVYPLLRQPDHAGIFFRTTLEAWHCPSWMPRDSDFFRDVWPEHLFFVARFDRPQPVEVLVSPVELDGPEHYEVRLATAVSYEWASAGYVSQVLPHNGREWLHRKRTYRMVPDNTGIHQNQMQGQRLKRSFFSTYCPETWQPFFQKSHVSVCAANLTPEDLDQIFFLSPQLYSPPKDARARLNNLIPHGGGSVRQQRAHRSGPPMAPLPGSYLYSAAGRDMYELFTHNCETFTQDVFNLFKTPWGKAFDLHYATRPTRIGSPWTTVDGYMVQPGVNRGHCPTEYGR